MSTPVRVALIGMGRMGQAIDALAVDRGCIVVSRIGRAEAARGIDAAMLASADVAIEFTEPASALANAEACARANCPVVIGTTGWLHQREQFEAVLQRHQARALWAPNFSLGVQLFLTFVHDAAQRLHDLSGTDARFDAHVMETHHATKKDAPSGTGRAVADQVSEALGRDVPITSVRTGFVPGTHEVIFDAPFEQIRLTHEARDRRVFADGALLAARWLASHDRPGLHSMRDVLEPAPRNTPS